MITNEMAAFAYKNGEGAVDFLEERIAIEIDAALEVAAYRVYIPGSFSAYGPTPTIQGLAAKIIGEVLGAGWEPPPGVKLEGKWENSAQNPEPGIPLALEYLAKCTDAHNESVRRLGES